MTQQPLRSSWQHFSFAKVCDENLELFFSLVGPYPEETIRGSNKLARSELAPGTDG